MRTHHRFSMHFWMSCALALCVSFPATAEEVAVPAELQQHVDSATQVFDSIIKVDLAPQRRALLEQALKDAHGFAVFPNIQKVGVGISMIQGTGVLAYRDRDGEWSPPIPLLVRGTSTGPHFGASLYDTLVVIKTPAAIERMLSGQLRLEGKEATGPIQHAMSPERDIVAYARNRGISAGLSLDDIHISLNQQAIAALYGRTVEPREIMSGQKPSLRRPPCAQKFLESANQLAGKSANTTYWK